MGMAAVTAGLSLDAAMASAGPMWVSWKSVGEETQNPQGMYNPQTMGRLHNLEFIMQTNIMTVHTDSSYDPKTESLFVSYLMLCM